MAIRKDVISAIVATFCLTVALFVAVPTLSQPSTPEYNPWADMNDDGIVDIFDVVAVTGIYESTGEPVKNVNVTNWPATRQTFPRNLMLRGTSVDYGPFAERYLIDRDTEYPCRNLPRDKCNRKDYDAFSAYPLIGPGEMIFYNATFWYPTHTEQSYLVQGYTSVSLTFNVSQWEPVDNWWEVHIYVMLGVNGPAGWRPLAQLAPMPYTYYGWGMLSDATLGAYFDATLLPRAVNPGEYLGINIVMVAEVGSGTFGIHVRLLYGMTEEMFVTIPIVENP
jgi:hypothetical protein